MNILYYFLIDIIFILIGDIFFKKIFKTLFLKSDIIKRENEDEE